MWERGRRLTKTDQRQKQRITRPRQYDITEKQVRAETETMRNRERKEIRIKS